MRKPFWPYTIFSIKTCVRRGSKKGTPYEFYSVTCEYGSTAERILLLLFICRFLIMSIICQRTACPLQAAVKSLASPKKCATQIGKTRLAKQMKLIELQFPSPSFPLSRSLDRDLLAFVAHTNTWLRLVPPQRSLLIRRIGHTQVAAQQFTRHTRFLFLSHIFTDTRTGTHTH